MLCTIRPAAMYAHTQGSTELWEHFPAELVDAALRIHHAALRSKLVAYDGYESCTEVRTVPCAHV